MRRRSYFIPEISLTAQRRTINVLTATLLTVALVIMMLVGTRRVTMHTPEDIGILHRAFAAVSPVIDGNAGAIPIPGDKGEDPISPLIGRKLNHWVHSSVRDGPWMIMLPASVHMNREEQRKTVDAIRLHPGARPVRRLSDTWKEDRLASINDSLRLRSWGPHQVIDFHEASDYLNLMKCDRIVVLSLHPEGSSLPQQEFLRYAFEWSEMGEEADCIVNLFSYEAREPQQMRYDAVLRAMHLVTSGTIARTDPKHSVPWILSVGPSTTFTGKHASFQDLLQKISAATGATGLKDDQPTRRLQVHDSEVTRRLDRANDTNEGGLLHKFFDWVVGDLDIDNATVPAQENLDVEKMPWHDEPGNDTVEMLMCQNKTGSDTASKTNSVSCAAVPQTVPPMYRFAFLTGTRSMCHYKYGPHVGAEMQLYRPSALAALIAGSMGHIMATRRHVTNESIALGKVLSVVAGLRGGDLAGLCKARNDGDAGRRRWYDACRRYRRLISARIADVRRFSGNSDVETLFGFSGNEGEELNEQIFVHESDRDITEAQEAALAAVRQQANRWLSPASEGAFRFFGGEVPSADWTLEGPDAVGITCGRWLAASGCTGDLVTAGVVAEAAAWGCGDMALTFSGCGEEQYYRSSFRNQVLLNPTCAKELSWERNADGTAFSFDSFAETTVKDGDSARAIINHQERLVHDVLSPGTSLASSEPFSP